MVCNVVNAKSISKALGSPFIEDWTGKFIKDKAVTGAAKVTLSVNARVGSVQTCKPGDHAAVLKVLDEVIADNPADFTGELKQFRAQVAAAQAADKDKK
jgi:hypothetical protein